MNKNSAKTGEKLVLAVTGATGARAAELLMDRSPWPISLVVSKWGRDVCAREHVNVEALAARAAEVLDNDDLAAGISSGSVATAGMVVMPCSTDTMAKIASGVADTLITRAAHCHLKEGRKLVLCVRESPWTLIDIRNAAHAAEAGAVVMPLSPPFYMFADREPAEVTMTDLLGAYVDRVLAVLGNAPAQTWEPPE
jgi:4-hydroxy-3-polyprenylbenzoate decarboxylase